MATTSHQRIAKNSIVLYLRMIVMMGISIFTTRIVLEGLGVVNFGIYNIVGGVIGFITMVTGALTISVERFLNFELGKDGPRRVSEVFSSSLVIHVGLALLLLLILETLGYRYFSTSIKIPAEQYQAAMTVYHLSSVASCIVLFSSPFLALSVSFERMGVYAGMTVGDVVLRLIAAYLILGVKSDRDMKLYCHAADIFAFPSVTRNEAFGVVLVESMYCQSPAVTFTIEGSGVNWVSPNGETCIEVENSNPMAYAGAIDRLLSDEPLRSRLAQNGKERAIRLFSRAAVEKLYRSLYNQLAISNSCHHVILTI